MRRTFWAIPILFLFAASAAPAAHADAFDFTISGVDSGSIHITAPTSGGIISAISGMFDGSIIQSLLPTGSIGGNDNVLSLLAPYLDGDGLSFSLLSADSDGYTDVNLYCGTGSVCDSDQGNSASGHGAAHYGPDTITLVATPTPEPGTFVLMLIGIGLVGLVSVMQKRKLLGKQLAS